jgi:hypothetical protein
MGEKIGRAKNDFTSTFRGSPAPEQSVHWLKAPPPPGDASMLAFFRKPSVHVVLMLLCCVAMGLPHLAAQQPDARVYVILWFDTEDYILPDSDNATLRIARFLTRELIRAVFKIVGERALSFERRGRNDVIEALKKHEIGFHARWHSVQPTPAQYMSVLGWDEGVAEFDRREKPGFDDVKRVLGQAPTCYGQPGSSWGPQQFGALKKWGVNVYLDAGNHVGLNNKPYYYGGLLNLYRLEHTLRANLDSLKSLEAAEDHFLAARKKLLAEGGGIVSIYYHPCEFVHKEFWDGVNFRNGANPPRSEWKLPPTKTPEQSKIAYEVFEKYIQFIKRFPDVKFITATEALELYRDRSQGRAFSAKELRQIATAVGDKVTYQTRGDHALAASEIFTLLSTYVMERVAGRSPDSVTLKGTPYGPSKKTAALTEEADTDASQFTRTAEDVADFVQKQGRIPTTVWLGSRGVPPEVYLRSLAEVALALMDGKGVPEKIALRPARFPVGDHVVEDSAKLWGWIIFPRGFRAPEMMELARRQAWTLKPAILHRAR